MSEREINKPDKTPRLTEADIKIIEDTNLEITEIEGDSDWLSEIGTGNESA